MINHYLFEVVQLKKLKPQLEVNLMKCIQISHRGLKYAHPLQKSNILMGVVNVTCNPAFYTIFMPVSRGREVGREGRGHSQKRIMKPFAFTKPHDFRVFTKEYN